MKSINPIFLLATILVHLWPGPVLANEPAPGNWSNAFDLPYLDDRIEIFAEYEPTSKGNNRYELNDTRPEFGLNTYWIAEVKRDGTRSWHGPLLATFNPVRAEWISVLSPFRQSTIVRFMNPTSAAVNLSVFSIDGRRVAIPFAGPLPAGVQELSWNGWNDRDGPVASGIYLLELTTPAGKLRQRVVKLR